ATPTHAKHGRAALRARRHGALGRYAPISAARSCQRGEPPHRERWLSWSATNHSARPVAVRPHEGRGGCPRYLCTLSQGWLPARPFLRVELPGEGRRRCWPRICGIARHGIGGEAPTRRGHRAPVSLFPPPPPPPPPP